MSVIVPLLWAVGWSSALLTLHFGTRLRAWFERRDTDVVMLEDCAHRIDVILGRLKHKVLVTIDGGTLESVVIVCSCCEAKNRVLRGVRDSRCARCKQPFTGGKN